MEEIDWDGQDAVFEAEKAKVQVEIKKHTHALQQAQQSWHKLHLLQHVSFDMIQHNNRSWRELVSEFRSEELYGGSTPSWAESAAPGIREYTHIRRGKDSLPGAPDGRRDSKG